MSSPPLSPCKETRLSCLRQCADLLCRRHFLSKKGYFAHFAKLGDLECCLKSSKCQNHALWSIWHRRALSGHLRKCFDCQNLTRKSLSFRQRSRFCVLLNSWILTEVSSAHHYLKDLRDKNSALEFIPPFLLSYLSLTYAWVLFWYLLPWL